MDILHLGNNMCYYKAFSCLHWICNKYILGWSCCVKLFCLHVCSWHMMAKATFILIYNLYHSIAPVSALFCPGTGSLPVPGTLQVYTRVNRGESDLWGCWENKVIQHLASSEKNGERTDLKCCSRYKGRAKVCCSDKHPQRKGITIKWWFPSKNKLRV